jgi:hypothetical protein
MTETMVGQLDDAYFVAKLEKNCTTLHEHYHATSMSSARTRIAQFLR